MQVYLAGALFSIAERTFNQEFSSALKELNKELKVVLPQEQDQEALGKENFEQLIFDHCLEGVTKSDVIIAFLEGPDVDSGTCIELGIAYSLKKRIIGIRTDFRGSEIEGLNIMVRKVLDHYLYFPKESPGIRELARIANELISK